MALGKNEAKFAVDEVGEVTGKTYKGVFKVKLRMSHRDWLKQDEIRRDLLGANPAGASPRALNLAEIFSFLGVLLLEKPEWWSLDLEDDTVVGKVYEQTIAARADALKELKEQAEADRKTLTPEG